MPPKLTQLLEAAPGQGEACFPLLEHANLRLEQIVSRGQASPAGFWYDQPSPEWVALLSGSATLEFSDGSLALAAGAAVLIPAHCRHRVAACSDDAIWLALHFQP